MKCDNCNHEANCQLYDITVTYDWKICIDKRICRRCYIELQRGLRRSIEQQKFFEEPLPPFDLGYNPYQE